MPRYALPGVAAALIFASSPSIAQDVPPPGMAVEASAPFNFFLVPSDEIGFKDCPQAFQLTYDGALNNGFGELDLKVDGQPLNNRIRTLVDGHIPIVQYSTTQAGLLFSAEIVGAPSRLDPREDLVALVRLRVSNPGSSESRSELSAEYAPRHGDARCDLPCRKWYQDKFMDSASFKAGGGSTVEHGEAIKNGHLVYLYSGEPRTDSNSLAVDYDLKLGPGQSEVIDLRVPFVPVDVDRSDELSKVVGSRFDSARDSVVDFWNRIFDRAMSVSFKGPHGLEMDPKVTDTMKSSLAYDVIARDIEADGRHFTQTVNKFQYHDFFMRDTSFIARSYELMDLPEVAKTTVEHYLIRDPSGQVVNLMHNMPDDWGQSLWALGSYIRATDDKGFAREILPAIGPHLDDFEKAVRSDPLGLWPVAGPYDNELINGHYTSHNLWALLGLDSAASIAEEAGEDSLAARARSLRKSFYLVFLNRLNAMTSQAQGYIPPGMDDPNAGDDWENASGGVYPFHVLPPTDPRAIATVNMERAYKYQEGIMTYGPNAWVGKQDAEQGKPFDNQWLHDYDTFQVTETLLAMGRQKEVVEDLYSVLVHTSSTNGGFETSIPPWGNRNPGGNYPPHGWFAARYNELVRNMLVREDGSQLVLASCLAPDWARPGETVRVLRALTNFGTLNFTIACKANGADVTIDPQWRNAPEKLRFCLPWFVDLRGPVRGAVVNGRMLAFSPSTRHLFIPWKWNSHPDLSYKRAVALWLQEAYQPKPGQDRKLLFP